MLTTVDRSISLKTAMKTCLYQMRFWVLNKNRLFKNPHVCFQGRLLHHWGLFHTLVHFMVGTFIRRAQRPQMHWPSGNWLHPITPNLTKKAPKRQRRPDFTTLLANIDHTCGYHDHFMRFCKWLGINDHFGRWTKLHFKCFE